jgi:hypothetical protein
MTDPLIAAARFLQSQLEWLRHATADNGEPYAVAAFAEIDHCAGRLRGLVNGPSEQRYLGPCGAEREHHDLCAPGPGPCFADDFTDACTCWCHNGEDGTCDGDIYAPRGGSVGRCRTCGATVASEDRQAWLDGEVQARAFRDVEISDAYGINVKTIRSWATRGKLTEHGRDRDDKPLYNVGDVLDLHAADLARRAGDQAKRARRAGSTRKDAA